MVETGTILLHENVSGASTSLLFKSPRKLLIAHTADDALAALAEMEMHSQSGAYLAGYFAYELGFVFEERLKHRLTQPSKTPLLMVGVYDAPTTLSAAEVEKILSAASPGRVKNLHLRDDFSAYRTAFDRVKAYIEAGDCYQINLTLKAAFTLEGDSLGLYRALAQSQPTAYGAYIDAGDHKILSRSPELFVSAKAGTLSARPMKGTLRRSPQAHDDLPDRARLASDDKNRAENLMIVDLLRNDISRVALPGSVAVTDLFTVETYRTLHTMTSGITAQLRPDLGVTDVLKNLFPCGSITGAPKLRAMEIIDELESGPRGLYTGSIGYIAPNGDFAFNVAIRTAVIDETGRGEIGVGGGIVADSLAQDEYQEALLKLQFLADPTPEVTLIETFKFSPVEGYVLRQRHMARLLASAQYFALPVLEDDVDALLDSSAQNWTADMRVRLTLSSDGLALTAVPLPPSPELFRFDIAADPMASTSVWLAHKTTHRAFYDEPKKLAHDTRGLDELVFLNERGELTEGSFTNLFIEREGKLFTPPLSAGLLPGTLRAELLAQGKAFEKTLTLADLATADAIFLGNSVRGLIRAQWVKDTQHDA